MFTHLLPFWSSEKNWQRVLEQSLPAPTAFQPCWRHAPYSHKPWGQILYPCIAWVIKEMGQFLVLGQVGSHLQVQGDLARDKVTSVLVGTILWYSHQIQGSSHEVEGPFKWLCGSALVMQVKQRVVPLPTQTDNITVGIWLGEREWYCPWGANQG